MAKYTMKLSKDGKEYDGEIEIDTKKGTETFHVPKAASNEEPGDVVYDFKRVSSSNRYQEISDASIGLFVFVPRGAGTVSHCGVLKMCFTNGNRKPAIISCHFTTLRRPPLKHTVL